MTFMEQWCATLSNGALRSQSGPQTRDDGGWSSEMAARQGALSPGHDASRASRSAARIGAGTRRFSLVAAVRGSTRRFAVRRGRSGLEFFAAQVTRTAEDGKVEYHGYPTHRAPGKVLRRFRDQGHFTAAEYRQLVKRLG